MVAAPDFFQLPAQDPTRENVLEPGELLKEIRVPSAAGWKSAYYEVRERAAFDWPLVSMAAALKLEGGTIKEARVVLGAVAPIPWRAKKSCTARDAGEFSAASSRPRTTGQNRNAR